MRKLTIIKAADSLASDNNILEFEKHIGHELPSGYRYFLKTYNPIQTKEKVFPKGDREYHIDFWNPLASNESSLLNAYEWTKELLKGEYIPIGWDSGDWLFVIGVTNRDYGNVFFCRTDYELDEALTLLANTFDEFIDDLRAASRNS